MILIFFFRIFSFGLFNETTETQYLCTFCEEYIRDTSLKRQEFQNKMYFQTYDNYNKNTYVLYLDEQTTKKNKAKYFILSAFCIYLFF